MKDSRRNFFKKTALLGFSGLAGYLIGKNKLKLIEDFSEQALEPSNPFILPNLPYSFDALEPFIDKQTMEIHHSKHHKAYVDKLNGADLSKIDLNLSDEQKCKNINSTTPAIIRNNLGGHYNHSLFWTLLKANPEAKTNIPKGLLAEKINMHFKSFDEFKKEFSDKSLKLFGSGWCWLIMDAAGKMQIATTPNQDNPLMQDTATKGKPILALDVWEHAYYLKYQNKRADYINNWWNLVNWDRAQELLNSK